MNKLDKIAQARKNYKLNELSSQNVHENPFQQFEHWFEIAVQSQKILEPNAMVLATANANGAPSARMVLLKGFGNDGLTFYTNYQSRKGQELLQNPQAALLFYWDALEKQIRIEGDIHQISAAESDQYFQQRPKGSQIGAWASPQSQIIDNRQWLKDKETQLTEQYADQNAIPRPPHWGGFRLRPKRFEFWQGRPSRLHDRFQYRLDAPQNKWIIERLAP